MQDFARRQTSAFVCKSEIFWLLFECGTETSKYFKCKLEMFRFWRRHLIFFESDQINTLRFKGFLEKSSGLYVRRKTQDCKMHIANLKKRTAKVWNILMRVLQGPWCLKDHLANMIRFVFSFCRPVIVSQCIQTS